MKDKELLEGLKSGDTEILTYIYKEIFPKVKYWILQNNGQPADAYDVFQEVMESILLNINNVYQSFGGMVMHMAKNKWIDRIRKEKTRFKVREAVGNRQEYSEDVENEYIANEKEYIKFKLLEKSFVKLSEICQQLMSMIREGKKVNEIVEQLAFKSANTLYRRKSACTERWSMLIKEDVNYKYCFE